MKLEKNRKKGFTLIEMLVIIGIIGILSGALITSMSHLKVTAKRARAQAAVSDAYTALNMFLQDPDVGGEWLPSMITALEMDEAVCKALAEAHKLDLSIAEDSANSTSLDRFGFLDEWGRAALKRNPSITEATQKGFDGINIEDHRIQFRLDLNLDGYVDGSEGSPKGLKIRSNVLVWSRGPDGKDDSESSIRYPYDDLISWDHGKVKAEN
ncbi:MAG: type II secretion system protein [Kiritimatiellae bacterium]|nr:type II secretion system protein [Kiritimatiellia bacterium]